MKKSLVTLVVLVGSIALAGTVFAGMDWGCLVSCDMGVTKAPCKNTVLCAGTAKGACPIGCGPCAPMVKFSGRWLTVAQCPAAKPVAKPKPEPDKFWAATKGACLACCVTLPAEAKKATAAPKAGGKKAPKK